MRIVTTFVLLLSLAAFAQETRSFSLPSNTVTVSAEGDFESPPDTAVITCTISAQEKTSAEAFQSASRQAEQMREALRNAGVDPKTAELTRYSLEPVYDYKSGKPKILGYRAGTNVTVKETDFAKIAPVTEALSNLNGTTNQNMSYELQDIDSAKAKAIEKAYARARSYAETIAKASGRQLGTLVSTAVDTQEITPVRPLARMAVMTTNGQPSTTAPTEEFQAEKIRVSARVNAVFGLQ